MPLETAQSQGSLDTGNVLAKGLLSEALAPVQADLNQLEQQLLHFIPTRTDTARAVLEHVLGAGGKRIRPALYFLACRLFNYRGPHLFEIGAVSEYVHTASLLHDDVVDNSSLRRNRPSANSIWGDEAAVLVGDLIYSRASELMAASGNIKIVSTFARAIRLMSEGELLQLENIGNPEMQVETYYKILEYKTATLIAAATKSAALLAGASEDETEALAEFGRQVGLAFQLIDDALDFADDADLLGKPTLADLPEGKVTLPLILLRERADANLWAKVEDAMADPERTKQFMPELAGYVEQYETAAMALERAKDHTDLAKQALNKLQAGAARDDLEQLADRLLFRLA